jgi:hypothetical protein
LRPLAHRFPAARVPRVPFPRRARSAPQILEHLNRSLPFTPADCRWVPVSPRFVVTGTHARGTGAVVVHAMTAGEVRALAELERPAGVKCATFGAALLEERNVAVGDYGGNVAILDLERGRAAGTGAGSSALGPGAPAASKEIFSAQGTGAGAGGAPAVVGAGNVVWSARAHASIVNCIDGCGGLSIGGGAPELATGSRDGAVKVWDPRVAEPVVSFEPGEGAAGRDCWSVAFGNAFNDEERCLAAGYDNGDVKVFDLRMNAVRWETNVGNGVCTVEFDRKDIEMNKLVAASLESRFRVFDCRTQHPVEGFAGVTEKAHKATVWLARHLPQNRDVWMTSGGNGGINLYRYNYPPKGRVERDADGRPRGVAGKVELVNARILSTQPFVGFDWSPDKEGLACAVCLDQTLRVFIVTKLGKL